MIRFHDESEGHGHRFPRVDDGAAARYVADIDETVPGTRWRVTLRYRLHGELRWQGEAVALDPLAPADGMHEYLYRNGIAERRFTVADGVIDGVETRRFSDGGRHVEIHRSRGLVQRVVTSWYDSGAVRSVLLYEDGESTGVVREYFPSGAVRRDTRRDAEGRREGDTVWYFENGRVRYRIPYHLHRTHGVVRGYYENGTLRFEQPTFHDALLEGTWRVYYPDGSPKWEIPVRTRRKHGVERQWDAAGTLIVHRIWADGRLLHDLLRP